MAPAKSIKKKKPAKRVVKSKKATVRRAKTTRKATSKRKVTRRVVKRKTSVKRVSNKKPSTRRKVTKRTTKKPTRIQKPLIIHESPIDINLKSQKLYRSGNEKIIAGVCGGIAEYFSIDPTLVRLLWVLGSLIYGIGIPVYLLAWLVIPKNPDHKWD